MEAVLIVDDDDVVLKVMSKAVDAAGIRYYATTSSEEAITRLASTPFTVLLTDLVMDEVSGIDLFIQAKRQHPLLRGIATSAFLDYDRMTRIIEAGFDDCLVKPIRREALTAAIQRSFALRHHWQERLADLRGLKD